MYFFFVCNNTSRPESILRRVLVYRVDLLLTDLQEQPPDMIGIKQVQTINKILRKKRTTIATTTAAVVVVVVDDVFSKEK